MLIGLAALQQDDGIDNADMRRELVFTGFQALDPALQLGIDAEGQRRC